METCAGYFLLAYARPRDGRMLLKESTKDLQMTNQKKLRESHRNVIVYLGNCWKFWWFQIWKGKKKGRGRVNTFPLKKI
jgi:hypothetical protein